MSKIKNKIRIGFGLLTLLFLLIINVNSALAQDTGGASCISDKTIITKGDCSANNCCDGCSCRVTESCTPPPCQPAYQCDPCSTTVIDSGQDAQPIKPPGISVPIPGLQLSSEVAAKTEGDGQYYYIPWIAEYVKAVYNFGVSAAAILCVVMIIFGGFMWLTAAGSAERVTTAKKYIIGSIIGLAIILSSYTILKIVNPALVYLKPMKVKFIPEEAIEIVDPALYQKITGSAPIALDSGEMATLAQQVAQENGVDLCVVKTILTMESGGKVNAIGHDENVRQSNISSRVTFIQSGKKFSGETFSSRDIAAKIFNDDKVTASGDLNLDWRFSHGIGLGQFTLFPPGHKSNPGSGWGCNGGPSRSFGGKCFGVKELLDAKGNLNASIQLFKAGCSGGVSQTCFTRYNGDTAYGAKAIGIYQQCKSGG